MRLCYKNDCRAGEYDMEICCFECDLSECYERCKKSVSDGCKFLKEVNNDTTGNQTGDS